LGIDEKDNITGRQEERFFNKTWERERKIRKT
jgi:hypothetical protein